VCFADVIKFRVALGYLDQFLYLDFAVGFLRCSPDFLAMKDFLDTIPATALTFRIRHCLTEKRPSAHS